MARRVSLDYLLRENDHMKRMSEDEFRVSSGTRVATCLEVATLDALADDLDDAGLLKNEYRDAYISYWSDWCSEDIPFPLFEMWRHFFLKIYDANKETIEKVSSFAV